MARMVLNAPAAPVRDPCAKTQHSLDLLAKGKIWAGSSSLENSGESSGQIKDNARRGLDLGMNAAYWRIAGPLHHREGMK